MYALCYASGEFVFARTIPVDTQALPIAHGPAKKLRERISAVARHAYDGETLLVPGIPEAPDQKHAMDALLRFMDWIRPSFKRDGLSVP